MTVLEDILTNAGFETAAADERPGEALGWTWEQYNGQFGGAEPFATFNTESGLEAYKTALEDFEAGFPIEPTMGTAAGYNNDWISSFTDAVHAFAQFNVGAGEAYSGTIESFDVWGSDGYTWVQDGPPWLESYAETFASITGWYASVHGSGQELETDSLEEAWGTDPLSTEAGDQWVPGQDHNGRLRGALLTFPIEITPDNRDLAVYDRGNDTLYRLELTTGSYADIASLVSMLNTVWAAEAGASFVEFTAFSDSTVGDALLWGWDGGATGSAEVFFGVVEKWQSNDARPALGLHQLSPTDGAAGLRMVASNIATKPADIDDEDAILLDSWSYIKFSVINPSDVAAFPHSYGMTFAEFDSDLSMTNYLEILRLDGWFGSGATWIDDISDPGVTVTFADFDYGMTSVETFVEGYWTDELY